MFWEVLPHYINAGMTADEFWKSDPWLAVAYRDVEIKRLEEKNQLLWLQGRYVFDAFAAVMSAAFGKKGSKPTPYPKEPYRVTPLTEAEIEAQKEAERKKAIASLDAWKAAWDRKYG